MSQTRSDRKVKRAEAWVLERSSDAKILSEPLSLITDIFVIVVIVIVIEQTTIRIFNEE